jgi:hypothetical protein
MVSAQGTDCWLEISPASTQVRFNEVFDVNVTFKNPTAQNISTIMCHINFTASLVEVTGVDYGATVGSPFVLALATPTWDNTTGWVDYDAGCSLGTTTNATSVVYATIHMKSKTASGIATVEFVPGTLVEPETQILDELAFDHTEWASVVNGTVTVSGAPVLTVNVVGSGNVKINNTITPSSYPNSTNWTSGDNVTLLAIPVNGWGFVNWTGDIPGPATANPSYVIMDSDKNVTAHFTELAPVLNVTPHNLTLTVAPNATDNRIYTVKNIGGGTLSWNSSNVTYDPAGNMTWLTQNITSGNLTANVSHTVLVTANTTGLEVGRTYNATINITGNSSVPLLVTLNVGIPGLPVISVSPTTLTFTTNEGENPADKTLEVWNSGSGTLNWSLSDNAIWLDESPKSGSSTGADDKTSVSVSVDASGMEVGDYSATITITGPGASNTPQSVLVNLHIVSAMPELPVAPASFSPSGLSISPHQVNPGQEVTISINVANTGGETGIYNAVLYINGAVEESQSVSVAPGMPKNVIFTVSKSDAGVYDVSLAGQSGQFEVVHTGWFGGGLGTGGIVAIVVIVIALILALVFMLRRTRRAV